MAVGIVVIHMSILARVCLANKRFAPNDVFAFVITWLRKRNSPGTDTLHLS